MTEMDPSVHRNSCKDESPTKEILDIRSSFPPRAPLSAQLEMAWLDGNDDTATQLHTGIARIEEITGRHNTI